MLSIRTREDLTVHDYHAHVMWQQYERRLAAAAERRRSVLEAVESLRTEAEPRPHPEGPFDTAAPSYQASALVETSA